MTTLIVQHYWNPPVNYLPSRFSACRQLFLLTLRRQFFSRQTLASFLLSLLCCLIVLAWSRQREPSTAKLAEQVLVPTFIAFLIPIYAICYGSSGIGGEREDKTLIFLLITSIPRQMVYLSKALAGMTLVGIWTVTTLATMCTLAAEFGRPLFLMFLPASLLGGLAYAMLFMFIGAAFRHGTIISLVYWFFLEVLFGNMPGTVKRVSLSFYVRCMVYDAGQDLKLGPINRAAREMFLPVTGETATVVLSSLIIGLVILGTILFEQREYRDAT